MEGETANNLVTFRSIDCVSNCPFLSIHLSIVSSFQVHNPKLDMLYCVAGKQSVRTVLPNHRAEDRYRSEDQFLYGRTINISATCHVNQVTELSTLVKQCTPSSLLGGFNLHPLRGPQ